MNKELHIWLEEPPFDVYTDFISTEHAILCGEENIDTTQPHFLQFRYGYRLFVHTHSHDVKGHEITLGECEGTSKCIREAHNLEKLLLAGAFDWWR